MVYSICKLAFAPRLKAFLSGRRLGLEFGSQRPPPVCGKNSFLAPARNAFVSSSTFLHPKKLNGAAHSPENLQTAKVD